MAPRRSGGDGGSNVVVVGSNSEQRDGEPIVIADEPRRGVEVGDVREHAAGREVVPRVCVV